MKHKDWGRLGLVGEKRSTCRPHARIISLQAMLVFWVLIVISSYHVLQSAVVSFVHPKQAVKKPVVMSSTSVALEQTAQSLFEQLSVQALDALQASLTQLAAQEMEELTDYTSATVAPSASEVAQQLQEITQGFQAAMQAEEKSCIDAYLSDIKPHNPEDVEGEMTVQDHEFIQSVEAVSRKASTQVNKMVAQLQETLTAAVAQNTTSQPAAAPVKAAAVSTPKSPAAQTQIKRITRAPVRRQERPAAPSWWQLTKDEFTRTANLFVPQFKKVVGQEVNNQIAVMGGSALSAVAKAAGVNNVVDQIKDVAHSLQNSDSPSSSVAVTTIKRSICVMYPVAEPTHMEQVEMSMDLSDAEKAFIANRTPKVQAVLRDKFGISSPLNIAFCCSGGGNRAMIVTTAILEAAARSNILHATMYCAGLSGATWAIAPWSYLYLTRNIKQDYLTSLQQMKANFVETLSDPTMKTADKTGGVYLPPLLNEQQGAMLSSQLVARYGYSMHISIVDMWGALISKYALKKMQTRALAVKWSELYSLAQSGSIPLPLCAAIFDGNGALEIKSVPHLDTLGSRYEWLEMSMFDTGSESLGFCKTQYFGSIFEGGSLVTPMPEYPLSFYLGMYGAAFGLTINDVVERTVRQPSISVMGVDVNLPVGAWITHAINENAKDDITSHRFGKIHAQFHNPAFGIPSSPLYAHEKVGFFDAGIAFNFPLPLCVQRPRGINVIIVVDSNPGDAASFKDADLYFERKRISMPKMGHMTSEQLMAHDMTVFNDPRTAQYNYTQPTIVYFPTSVDVSKAPYVTTNFKYSKQDIDNLSTIAASKFQRQVPELIKIFKLVAENQERAQQQMYGSGDHGQALQDYETRTDEYESMPQDESMMLS